MAAKRPARARATAKSRAEERSIDLPRPSAARVTYGLVYPNAYGVGMANLGFQTLWGLFSALPEARCERLFSGDARTLEGNRRLGELDVVAFCVPFEGDYPALAEILVAQGIEVLARNRPADAPLVIVGGVAPSLNPEVLAPIADAIYIGEAEGNLDIFHKLHLRHASKGRGKDEFMRALAVEGGAGWYVPAAYEVSYSSPDGPGEIERRALWEGAPDRVVLARAPKGWEPAHTRVSASTDAFGGAFLVEIVRGCPHGCAFCAIGHFGGRTRFIEPTRLYPLIDMGLESVGRVGLVGAAVGDHPKFKKIAAHILDAGGKFTVSSFRAELLDDEALELLAAGGLKTLTVALEAGSSRLRASINKKLEAEKVIEAARMAGDAGLSGLRIYAMVGLPGESDEDVLELAAVAAAARRAIGRGRVTLSVAPFVPKPHTPLQWEPMAGEALINKRIRLLKKVLEGSGGVQVSSESAKWARVQGLFSKGDRRIGELLAANPGQSGWGRLTKGVLASNLLDSRRPTGSALPWSFIDGAPRVQQLEQKRAKFAKLAATKTPEQ
jgi:radical SAM superfamily enzyme YgiQ (UPF0313 family)